MKRTQLAGIGLAVTAALAGVWAVQSGPGKPTLRTVAATPDRAPALEERVPAPADLRPADLHLVPADAASVPVPSDAASLTNGDSDHRLDSLDLAQRNREITPGCFAWSPRFNHAACMTGQFSKEGFASSASYSLNIGDFREFDGPFDSKYGEFVLILKGEQVSRLHAALAEGQYDESFPALTAGRISPRETADLLIRIDDHPPIAWLRVRWSQMLISHNEDETSVWNDYQTRLSVRCLPPEVAVKSPELVLTQSVATKDVPPLPKGVRGFEFDLDQYSGADELSASLQVMPGGRFLLVEIFHYRELEGQRRGSNEATVINLAEKCPRAFFRLPKMPLAAASATKAPTSTSGSQ